ncbi:hypothetical protein [Streptomyces sp. NBC_01217]|uniref:hypothetical protein n=1 Tax=Streptomyces sp. NBC_01217 TaxID=2903779 RepID=UPI002E0F4A2E|nr:hypothetical protein OG507_38200 [Streptomyces sp. NBC_01217]
MPIPPSYDEIVVTRKSNSSWQSNDPQGRVYSFELTVTAVSRAGGEGKETRRFRISFDLRTAHGTKVEASGVDVTHEDGKVYIDSRADQLLEAGNSRPVAVQITVPGDPAELPTEYPLDGLKAVRLA